MRTNIDPTATVAPDVVTRPKPDAAAALRRALKLLQAASPDWHRKGPTDGDEPLHWPAAVAAARAQVEHAVRLLERT